MHTSIYCFCQFAYTTKPRDPRDPYSAIRIVWLSGISTLTVTDSFNTHVFEGENCFCFCILFSA